MEDIYIKDFKIENFGKPYVIAEIGSNHNGDIDLAKKLILAAKECGAHAVKFQSWSPSSLISNAEYENNQSYNDGDGGKKHFGSLRQMVEKYYLREDQHYILSEFCVENNIDFCSTPFSQKEVDLLISLDVPFIKIASMDINNIKLLKYVSKFNKPILLSTGMSNLQEIDKAIRVLKSNGNNKIVLLHCISIYPPAYEDINLRNITMLQNTFNLPVGFSDHTIGVSIPISSVALGSCVIEKHFTLDKNLPGWDHQISADPIELNLIVKESLNVYKSLGSFSRIVSNAEQFKLTKFRRSVVSTRDMKKGEVICENDLDFKRPGTGIKPDEFEYLIGRKLRNDITNDHIFNWSDFV